MRIIVEYKQGEADAAEDVVSIILESDFSGLELPPEDIRMVMTGKDTPR